MTGKEIIADLMRRRGMTNSDMADRLHVSQATVWARLDKKQSDNMTVRTLQNMANVLGYETIVVPIDEDVSEGAYAIGDSYDE